jgi:hypothetical protein
VVVISKLKGSPITVPFAELLENIRFAVSFAQICVGIIISAKGFPAITTLVSILFIFSQLFMSVTIKVTV